MYKLIINDLTLEFKTWEELQMYLYNLDRKNGKDKNTKTIYKVQTNESFRISFDD